jgi:osmoprotectant transport system permease protein
MSRGITSRPTGSSPDRGGPPERQDVSPARFSQVGTLGSLLGLAALVMPWMNLHANRLAAGNSVGLLQAAGTLLGLAIAGLWVVALAVSLHPLTSRRANILGAVGCTLLPLTLLAAGTGAARLLEAAPSVARASLGAAVWLSVLATYLLVHTARAGLLSRPRLRVLLTIAGPLALVVLGVGGVYDHLSLMVEFAGNEQRFAQEINRHLALSLGSVAIGACIAIPLGITAARSRRLERPIFLISSAVETIPSLALFGLIIAPLSALSFAYPALREIGIRGVGAAPALIALVLYSLLPIVHNTYAGVRQVSPAALDAGHGMGMSRRQLLWRVQYPLALPLIGEGVRTAAVQSVGNTTVAALIGAGGLGHFIFQGLGQAAADLILLGALTVIALALAIDLLARYAISVLTPAGLRPERGQ